MEAKRYKKRPIIIEAMQLRWDNWGDMCEFAPVGEGECRGVYVNPETGVWSDDIISDIIGLLIPTLEGVMLARQNDYIIKGVHGEFYPCKPDIFEETYEPA